MKRLPHLYLCYLARLGVEYRVQDRQLFLRHSARMSASDKRLLRGIKGEIIDLIESREEVTDTFSWPAWFDTAEHQDRKLQ